MPNLLVIARVPLPDIAPIGATVAVRQSRRIEALIARGLLDYVGIAPHDTDADPLPIGTVSELMRWTGDDPAKAAALLERERASNAPRSSLIARLSSIVDPLGPTHPDDDWPAGERYALVGA